MKYGKPDYLIKFYSYKGSIGDDRTVFRLIDTLKDKNFNVRNAVVKTLGMIRDERAVGHLMDILKAGDQGHSPMLARFAIAAKAEKNLRYETIKSLSRIDPWLLKENVV